MWSKIVRQHGRTILVADYDSNATRDLAQATNCDKSQLLSTGYPEAHGFYLANDCESLAQGFLHYLHPGMCRPQNTAT